MGSKSPPFRGDSKLLRTHRQRVRGTSSVLSETSSGDSGGSRDRIQVLQMKLWLLLVKYEISSSSPRFSSVGARIRRFVTVPGTWQQLKLHEVLDQTSGHENLDLFMKSSDHLDCAAHEHHNADHRNCGRSSGTLRTTFAVSAAGGATDARVQVTRYAGPSSDCGDPGRPGSFFFVFFHALTYLMLARQPAS